MTKPLTFEEALTDAINKHAVDYLLKSEFSYRAFDEVRATHYREVQGAARNAEGLLRECEADRDRLREIVRMK